MAVPLVGKPRRVTTKFEVDNCQPTSAAPPLGFVLAPYWYTNSPFS
jgi:hypothetical protein